MTRGYAKVREQATGDAVLTPGERFAPPSSGDTSSMSWEPELTLSEIGGRCRLVLGGMLHGDGDSLQEAADALVARVSHVGLGVRSDSAMSFTPELLPLNRDVLDFLYRIGDAAAEGQDVRGLVFGTERRAA